MGDSACFMPPAFSYTSGVPNEAYQGNPVNALGERSLCSWRKVFMLLVSFWRFMTESLAWEKWSSFSVKKNSSNHKDVSKSVSKKSEYSRNVKNSDKATKDFATPLQTPIAASASKKRKHPSVTSSSVNKSASCSKSFSACQKTLQSSTLSTLFLLRTELRAEKRKQRLEERFNEKETEKVQMRTKSKEKSETIKQDSQEVVLEKNQDYVVSTDGLDANEKREKSEVDWLDCADLATEQKVLVEICPNVDKQNMVSGLDTNGTPKIAKSLVKKNSSNHKDVSKSVSKKRPVFSSLRSSVFSKVTSSPAKFVAPPLPRKEINNLTPRTIKSKMNFTDMKRSTPKPHRKSINFTTAAEPDTLSTLAIRKSEYSRNVQNSYKATKDFATPLRTPVTASVSKKPKHPSVTPSSVNKSASCSKSFSACQKTLQSSTLSTPFLLRTELKAEKRKQRLEERFNEKETEKVQMRTKSKEKSEAEVWKLRQSLCFRARPLPEFYRERKTQEMQSQSPKVDGKSCASTTEAKNPLTRSSTKNSAFKNVSEKNSQTPSRNLSLPALTPRKIHSEKLSTGQHKQH